MSNLQMKHDCDFLIVATWKLIDFFYLVNGGMGRGCPLAQSWALLCFYHLLVKILTSFLIFFLQDTYTHGFLKIPSLCCYNIQMVSILVWRCFLSNVSISVYAHRGEGWTRTGRGGIKGIVNQRAQPSSAPWLTGRFTSTSSLNC